MIDENSLDYAIGLAERVLREPGQCTCGLGTLARAVVKMAREEIRVDRDNLKLRLDGVPDGAMARIDALRVDRDELREALARLGACFARTQANLRSAQGEIEALYDPKEAKI